MTNMIKEKDELCLADDLLGSKVDRSRPKVRPAMHPAISRFLENSDLAFALVDGFGSPLNVIFPQHINAPIDRFERVYRDRHLQGKIFYTSKPNKSVALKKQAALSSVGLDV